MAGLRSEQIPAGVMVTSPDRISSPPLRSAPLVVSPLEARSRSNPGCKAGGAALESPRVERKTFRSS
jgi:hypothetical protein